MTPTEWLTLAGVLVAILGISVAMMGILVSVITAIFGAASTVFGSLVALLIKGQIKTIIDRMDLQDKMHAKLEELHTKDIDKISSTMEVHGEQLVKCVEQIKSLFNLKDTK